VSGAHDDAATRRAGLLLRALADAVTAGRPLAWAAEHLPAGGDPDAVIRAAWQLCAEPWAMYRLLDVTAPAARTGAAFERMSTSFSRHGHGGDKPCRDCADAFRALEPEPAAFAEILRGRR
jgi:hypothetical protein